MPGAASVASVASSAPRSRPSTRISRPRRIRRRTRLTAICASQPRSAAGSRSVVQLLERRHERVLHDLFTFAAVAEQARRDREQVGRVAAVQHLATPAIAFDGARHQLSVAGGVRILKQDGVAHQNAHCRGLENRASGKGSSGPVWVNVSAGNTGRTFLFTP